MMHMHLLFSIQITVLGKIFKDGTQPGPSCIWSVPDSPKDWGGGGVGFQSY